VNGNLFTQLVPNATATPPANIYTVNYQSSGNQQFTETWTVPVSASPLTVSVVRTSTASSNSTASAGNASTFPESAIVGLPADLAQRPLKGVGYGTNGVAVVDDSGNLITAIGDPGTCVYVDGTTGPCTGDTFADAETPGGTLDGVNSILTLAQLPLGSSLMLFRNGLFQTPNFDYTLSGQTVTFTTGIVPQPGDTMTASYRVDTSNSGNLGNLTNPVPTISPQVICSATGTSTAVTSWTTLGGCDIPATGLKAGDRIEVRFTFAHTGTTTGYNLQINWGNTAILARTASAQDVAVAGTAEAAVSATGALLSVESWGTVLPFLPALLNAPVQSGLEVTFRAAMTAVGPDNVALTNYTVLRYPGN
jgi:hypothetical protein